MTALAQIPAFPGAEGFGAYATGGRGGDVYYVKNLNSSGAGSLLYGVQNAPASGRTIVFAVSGYIPIANDSHLGNKTVRIVQNKVTIAGQTAPGDGIALKDGRILVTGNNVVLQHLRVRHGKYGGAGDCLNIDNGVTNLMMDHVSFAFSTDENISSFEQNPLPDFLTLQWSLNGWGLESHSCGGLWDLGRVTTHHSLWSHNHTRNPKARPSGLLDWINNVTFDWDIGFIMGDSTTPASWKANVRGNYFVCPPGNTRSVALEKASIDRNGAYNFTLHVDTNLFDKNGDTLLNGSDYGYGIASGSYQVSNAPIVVSGLQVPVTIDSPLTAYKKIVSSAGPLRLDALSSSPIRDEVDAIYVNNLVTLKRNHVTSETGTGASNSGWGYLSSTPAPADTDQDGMPDTWEQSLGWNANSDDHNTALASSGGVITGLTFFPSNTVAGYTRLEEYLYFLTLPHATIAKNTTNGTSSLTVDLRKFVSGFNKAPVTFTLSGATNGTVVLQPDGYTAVFTPTLDFFGRARFFFNVTDGDGGTWTQPLLVLVSGINVPRDLKWQGDGSANLWNTNALNFLSGATPVAYAPGDNVLFDDTGSASPAVSIPFVTSPSAIDVNAAQNYTFSGVGSLVGSGPMTKLGSGTLTINTTNNSYSGTIDLGEGGLTLGPGTTLGTGACTLRGGAVFKLGNSGTVQANNPINIPAGENGTAASDSLGNRFAGAFTGDSTSVLNISGGVSFNQTAPQFTDFPGTVVIPAGSSLRFSGTSGSNGGTSTAFDLNGTLQMRNSGTTGHLGALTGTGTLGGAQSPSVGTVTYSIGAKNLSTTFGGSIVDANTPNTNTAIIKVGSGTLTLTGTTTHSGTTTVNAGTLLVNGTNILSPATVASGATLGGSGKIGGLVTVNSGGKLAPGNSAGTLTVAGGLTLNSATLNFELANVTTPGGGVNDLIAMTGGALTLSGTSVVTPTFLNGSLASGTYTLISGGSSTTGSAANLSWGGASGGRQTFSFDTATAGTAKLVVSGTAGNLVWHGLVNTNWDLSMSNWLNAAVQDRFFNLDTATFDDTGLSKPLVNFTANVSPATVTVNSSGNYTFGGSGALTGSGTLVKSGSGTLNLNITNSSFAGDVWITGGTLNLQGAGSKLNTGNLTIGGNAIFNLPPSSPAYFYTGTITVPAGQTGTIYSPGLGNGIDGNLIAGGTNSVLNLSSGVSFRGITSTQFDSFNGTIHILPGATLRFSADSSGNTYGSLNPTFIIDGALRPRNAGNTIRLGALSGSGSIEGPQSNGGSGDTVYLIGGNNQDVTFDGNISSNNAVPGTVVILDKIGTGKLTLNGSSSFTGGTTVEAGSLIINNTIGTGTGTGDLAVLGGATLGATGIIGSSTTLADSAILAPGDSGPGILTFTNDLDIGEFTTLNFELGSSSDRVVANAALTVAGILNVTAGPGFGPGNYTLFTYNPASTFNNSDIAFGSLPAGYNYSFDTNTTGVVKLVVSLPTPPVIGHTGVTGGKLVFSGSGGTPGADYHVLTATNLATPATNWLPVLTNQFDSNGNFAVTNTPATNAQTFYRLKVP